MRLLLAIGLVLIILSGSPASGQTTPGLHEAGEPLGSPIATPAPASQPLAATRRSTYLPLVRRGSVTIRFASSTDSSGNLTGVGTEFAYGLTRLFYEYRITGAKGQHYSGEWTVNGQRIVNLDTSGVCEFDLCGRSGQISRTDGAPLGQGTYLLTVYVAGQYITQATATIR